MQRAQHRRRKRIEAIGDAPVAAVGGVQELHQVVGADREEIHALDQRIELEQQRRHLDHGADLDAIRQLVAAAAQRGQLALDQLLGLVELGAGRDHREHDLQLAAGGGLQQRADLAAHQARPVEPEPDRAPAERRVLLGLVAHVGQDLVAADIERAERHRLVLRGIEHRAVERELIADARHLGRDHELQFGAEQADAAGAGLGEMRQVDQQAGVDHQRDRLAVLGDAWLVAQRAVLRLAAGAQLDALAVGDLDVGRRPQMHVAGRAIDDDGVAGIDEARDVFDLADRGDAERPRNDRDMRGRAAFLQDQAAQLAAVVVEQRRRPHRAGDQDGVVGQLLARRRVVLAHELAHQPIAEVVEVVQPLAQIRIGDAHHAGAGVGLHALDAGLGGEAGADRLAQPMQPALVVGEAAVGVEHLAVLAAVGDVAALQHQVELGAQRRDRIRRAASIPSARRRR